MNPRFKHRSHRLACMAATTLWLAAPASGTAEPPRGGHAPQFPISIAEAREQSVARFSTIDADGNGEISRAEFDQAEQGPFGPHGRFRRGWQPHPGAADHDTPHPPHGVGESDEDAELFAALDENGDGQLAPPEFGRRKLAEATRTLWRDRLFQRLDRDGNGSLSAAEMPGAAHRLEALDADGDGTVTKEEADRGRRAKREPAG